MNDVKGDVKEKLRGKALYYRLFDDDDIDNPYYREGWVGLFNDKGEPVTSAGGMQGIKRLGWEYGFNPVPQENNR